jgi:hypothetical protein
MRRNTKILIALGVLIAAGCDGPAEPNSPLRYAHVFGNVRKSDGTPASGSIGIACDNAVSVSTNAGVDGTYNFRGGITFSFGSGEVVSCQVGSSAIEIKRVTIRFSSDIDTAPSTRVDLQQPGTSN